MTRKLGSGTLPPPRPFKLTGPARPSMFAGTLMWRSVIIVLLAMALLVGSDQWTKLLAVEHLQGQQGWVSAGDLFRLTYAENRGAFLGLGSDWPAWVRTGGFIGMSLVVIAVGAVKLFSKGFNHRVVEHWAWLLVIAGAIGNLIDRVFNPGYVVDFMNMGIGGLRTGIFNVADVHIMVGLGLLLFFSRPQRESTKQSSEPPATGTEEQQASSTAPGV